MEILACALPSCHQTIETMNPKDLKFPWNTHAGGEIKGRCLRANEGRNVSPRQRFHIGLIANETTL